MANGALNTGRPPVLCLEGADLAPPGRTTPLLRGVDLELREGEVAVLLGGNGSGKSTLLRSAAGLWPLRGGRRIVPEPGEFDAGRIGIVLEDPSAQFVAGSVRGELEFVLENRGWSGADIAARVADSLSRFGISELQDQDPRRLSPGEQERCLLATATLLEPSLLLLDDAFLYLGEGEALTIWRHLTDEVRSRGGTGILLACHDAELAVHADKVGVLAEGGLMAWGPPGVVLRKDLPPPVEVALGVWLERRLRREGWDLPGDALDPEGMTTRLLRELGS